VPQPLGDPRALRRETILLGSGVSVFAGLTGRVRLRLDRTITFRNGNALLCYTPEAP
jgi:CRISPR/Cas system endoribonuclease Cas6 (RAMP superfamily)